MKTIVKKPWGHEEIWAQTNDYVGKILFIKEGQFTESLRFNAACQLEISERGNSILQGDNLAM